MATITFKAPNYRCRISESDRQERVWRLCYAESEAQAREFFERQEFIVHRVDPYDFNEVAKGEKERVLEAIQNEQRVEWNSLWGRLKKYLQELFHSTCAYCESTITHTAFGDVEHYRPKGKVAEDPDHPGYYWRLSP